jgi:hypothetical protein
MSWTHWKRIRQQRHGCTGWFSRWRVVVPPMSIHLLAAWHPFEAGQTALQNLLERGRGLSWERGWGLYQGLLPSLALLLPITIAGEVPLFQCARRGARNQLAPHTYLFTRWLFLRLLGATYLCAFVSFWPQLRGLIGRNGIAPAASFLEAVQATRGPERYWRVPTLAWLHSSDAFLQGICGGGILLSLLLILDLLPGPGLLLPWICYLSLVSIGQEFLAFQWDALLLETGFLAIFFAPWQIRPGWSRAASPSRMMVWLLRWLLFRLMFGSGYIKLASGDPTWRSLTALTFHYETQPLPTPVAWYMHQLPRWFHRWSAMVMFTIELLVPFMIFAPRRMRFMGAGLLAGLQLAIMLTGNYGFFNLLSLVLCIPLLDDSCLSRALPAPFHGKIIVPERTRDTPGYERWLHVPLAMAILGLSGVQLRGTVFARAPLLRRARILTERLAPLLQRPRTFAERLAPLFHYTRTLPGRLAPLHLVNSYGLFAVMTTSRPEIVVEGSNDGITWVEYTFRYKPGDVHRRPGWVAPHQPRLDWQMWFAALRGPWGTPWFSTFMLRLLEGAPDVLGLLETNPFPEAPPRYIRALLYDYRFTDASTKRVEGAWWRRELQGLYFPVVTLQKS